MENREYRYLPITNLEIRNDQENSKMCIEGYVVEFNKQSLLLYDEFYEKVAKGAFAKSLESNTIKALWNHNTSIVLGSTKSGTLKVEENERGLRFELELPNNVDGKNVYESIKRGDVDGVSFGFNVREDKWEYNKDDDIYIRTLLDVNLYEISPTPFPAYSEASSVEARDIFSKNNIETKEQRKTNEKIAKLNIRNRLLEIERGN